MRIGPGPGGSPRKTTVAALVLALSVGISAPCRIGAQLTRAVSPAVANEQRLLDSYLRPGRTVAGTRANAQALRQLYAARIPNPFLQLLREADELRLTDVQADSIAVINRNYARVADSAWSNVGRYLAALPEEYDVTDAWTHVSAGFTVAIDRLVTFTASARTLITTDQLSRLSRSVVQMLDSTCIRGLHPAAGAKSRIGGAGANGVTSVRSC